MSRAKPTDGAARSDAPAADTFDTDSLGARVIAGLAKIGLATRQRAWTEGHGLTPLQGQILASLRARPESGSRLSEIAEALAITAPTATVAVQALERKGLVRKMRAADDRRARVITLTDAGQREAARSAGWADFLLMAVDTLTPVEQTVFLRSLVKMIGTLQVRGEIPVSRMCVDCRYFRPNVHCDTTLPHHCAFVDAPFGDRSLRLDCADFEVATEEQARRSWERFTAAD